MIYPVEAAASVLKDVPVELRAVGTVESYKSVSVKSLIGGLLQKVHFEEGREVKAGQILFSIDPRPYEAAVKQAEANLLRDTAQMENAKKEARRYEELVLKEYVPKSQYDDARTAADAFSAVVAADKAAVDNARSMLEYCSIKAAVTGRTGNLFFREGALIKANDDKAMVVINQIRPIYVDFTVPSQYLDEIRRRSAGGKIVVEAGTPQNEADRTSPSRGVLTFIDNSVDATTGTVHLKATFDNADEKLWPGLFVNVLVKLSVLHQAVVVPSQAVTTGQSGRFVFVIKDDMTVEVRDVTTGMTRSGETIIEKGLNAGERVVTDGQLKLTPGAKVKIKDNRQEGDKPSDKPGNKPGDKPGDKPGEVKEPKG
jgi:multidrug efflux system membrane fusion protein